MSKFTVPGTVIARDGSMLNSCFDRGMKEYCLKFTTRDGELFCENQGPIENYVQRYVTEGSLVLCDGSVGECSTSMMGRYCKDTYFNCDLGCAPSWVSSGQRACDNRDCLYREGTMSCPS
jgi:hypothetical protein